MKRILLALGLSVAANGVAMAQGSPCGGGPVAEGQQVRGPVLHVIDGHTLCVAQTPDPATWVRLELSDAPAGATWAELMSVGFGKDVVCVAGATGATCQVEGRPLSAALRAPGVKAASAAWRPGTAPPLGAAMRVATAN